jgi:hypothetical protein
LRAWTSSADRPGGTVTRLSTRRSAHFGEWWLLGTPSTAQWGRQLFDVTNHFILEGVRGGLISMVLFIATLALSFRAIGIIWRRHAADVYRERMAWALGVALFIHCMNFIAVSYFGQIIVVWYLHLAVISSLSTVEAKPAGGAANKLTRGRPIRRSVRMAPVPVRNRPGRTSALPALN